MKKITALVLPLMLFSLNTIQACAGVESNGALVILDEPDYPWRLVFWDDVDNGFAIVLFLIIDGSFRTMIEGLTMWLPEQARSFALAPYWAYTVSLRGDEVPVGVWRGRWQEIVSALHHGDWEFLDERLEAEGEVHVQWTEKSGVSIMFSVRGTVDRVDGTKAFLTALFKGTIDFKYQGWPYRYRNTVTKIEFH